MADIKLVVGKSSFMIPRSWIPRWEALSNVVNEMNSDQIDWTLNSSLDLRRWILLNEAMDVSIGSSSDPIDLIDYSSVARVIDYMLPANDNWLLYVYIDETLDDSLRKSLYYQLGRKIRSERIMLPYNDRAIRGTYVHRNLRLNLDPVYRTDIATLDQRVYKALLDLPVNIVTGIMHVAWLGSRSKNYHTTTSNIERDYLQEVPWDLVRWKDMVEMAPGHLSRIDRDLVELIDCLLKSSVPSHLGYSSNEELTEAILSYLDGRSLSSYRLEYPTEDIEKVDDRIDDERRFWAGLAPSANEPSLLCPRDKIYVNVLRSQMVVRLPNPGLYITRLCQRMKYISKIPSLIECLIQETRLSLPDPGPMKFITLIDTVISGIASEVGIVRGKHLIESQCLDFCTRLNDSLGSLFLLTIVEVMSPTASTLDNHSQNRDLLLQSMARVAEKSDTPNFTRWPTLHYWVHSS